MPSDNQSFTRQPAFERHIHNHVSGSTNLVPKNEAANPNPVPNPYHGVNPPPDSHFLLLSDGQHLTNYPPLAESARPTQVDILTVSQEQAPADDLSNHSLPQASTIHPAHNIVQILSSRVPGFGASNVVELPQGVLAHGFSGQDHTIEPNLSPCPGQTMQGTREVAVANGANNVFSQVSGDPELFCSRLLNASQPTLTAAWGVEDGIARLSPPFAAQTINQAPSHLLQGYLVGDLTQLESDDGIDSRRMPANVTQTLLRTYKELNQVPEDPFSVFRAVDSLTGDASMHDWNYA